MDLAALIAAEVRCVLPTAAFVALESSNGILRLGSVFDSGRRPVCLRGGLISGDEVRDSTEHLDTAADAAALLVLDEQAERFMATGFGSPTVLDLGVVLAQAADRECSSRHQRGSGL